jgi:hypothetical protein
MLRIINIKIKDKETLHVRDTSTGTVNATSAPAFTKLLHATQRMPRSLTPCLPKSENKRAYEYKFGSAVE